ncbi:hypothetical protein QJS04_geneDACA010439 [Acorus gramineus]|uniref:Uncharacterized protein n=1 Tax=Acorus gramineus TaxID=55184 RepID=A0AAV9A2C6_ACOGR|nr:hypothetical protein QJS04_geneDACA010439 [Acorus gramineus]
MGLAPAQCLPQAKVKQVVASQIFSTYIMDPLNTNDINTVCFADETGHVIYSGGDDYLCKEQSEGDHRE